MSRTIRFRLPMAMIPLLLVAIGCSPPLDDRLIDLSREAANRQAQQNQTIAEQSRQVSETTREFVGANAETRKEVVELQRELAAADGQARQEVLAIQRELADRDTECRQQLNTLQRETQSAMQGERSNIDRQREDLEAERRKIAKQRHRAPVVAAAVQQVGLVLACMLPLALCGYLLFVLRTTADSGDDEAMAELLIEELATDRPRFLLPGPRATAEQPALSHSEAMPEASPDDATAE